jgi:hypothetical protein
MEEVVLVEGVCLYMYDDMLFIIAIYASDYYFFHISYCTITYASILSLDSGVPDPSRGFGGGMLAFYYHLLLFYLLFIVCVSSAICRYNFSKLIIDKSEISFCIAGENGGGLFARSNGF